MFIFQIKYKNMTPLSYTETNMLNIWNIARRISHPLHIKIYDWFKYEEEKKRKDKGTSAKHDIMCTSPDRMFYIQYLQIL